MSGYRQGLLLLLRMALECMEEAGPHLGIQEEKGEGHWLYCLDRGTEAQGGEGSFQRSQSSLEAVQGLETQGTTACFPISVSN